MAEREAVIVGAVRTPVGRYAGALKGVRADDLAGMVVGEVVRRTGERTGMGGSSIHEESCR